MKKRKVAIVLVSDPQVGGGHQYALLVAQSLLKHAGEDYELVAICQNHFWRRWCRKNGVRRIQNHIPNLSMAEKKFNCQFSFVSKIYYTYFTYMGWKIREEGIDVLLPTQQGVYIPNYKVKLVVPVHDLMHRYEPSFPEVSQDYESREILMKSWAKYAAGVLVDSKLGKKQFEESYLKGFERNINIVSLPFVTPRHIREKEEAYVQVPEKYVFYPAQFWQHKNHINLIKAIQIAKENNPDMHLVLVGAEKNNFQNIKDYIKENDLKENVTILGFVSDEKITYLYKHAVGLIMPSYFGPTNIPPLEAMALGCPVAVSNKYAMPEQVGDAGLLFNPDSPKEIAECIEAIWRNDSLREKMILRGYRQIEQWGEKEFEEKLVRIIKNI